MDEEIKRPLWVELVFSVINKRIHALMLIWVSVLFTLYCVPWRRFLDEQSILAKLLVIEDWSWLAMMAVIMTWYLLALRWMDRNKAWE